MKNTPNKRSDRLISVYQHEKTAWKSGSLIFGIDEAGRGCMAGPLVVAAAMLNPNKKHPLLIDSKKLSKDELLTAFAWICKNAIFTTSIASPREIDRYNIYQTTKLYMRKVCLNLITSAKQLPSLIAIDAMPLDLKNTPYANIAMLSMIQGESKSASIAAASIVAKVTRDAIMQRMDQQFPSFKIAEHKGYCTKTHQQNVTAFQPSIIHRTSYLSWMHKDSADEQKSIFC